MNIKIKLNCFVVILVISRFLLLISKLLILLSIYHLPNDKNINKENKHKKKH